MSKTDELVQILENFCGVVGRGGVTEIFSHSACFSKAPIFSDFLAGEKSQKILHIFLKVSGWQIFSESAITAK